MSELPHVSPEVLAWLRKNSPIITVYGDTGQGKTTLAGTLFHRAEYWPVRYIEGDDGASTIAQFAHDESICQYRNYSDHRRPGQDDFHWFLREIEAAKTADCGSIIIEGFSRHYQSSVNAALKDSPDASGNLLRKLYIPAANRLAALIGAAQEIKRHRKQHETGVPIVITLNVREQTFTDGGKQEHRRLLPALSPNKSRIIMESSDVFAQIERDRHGTRLLGDLDDFNNFRKVRNDGLLQLMRSKRNPDLPWLIDEWVRVETEQKSHAQPIIEQLLAQLQQQQQLNNDENKS